MPRDDRRGRSGRRAWTLLVVVAMVTAACEEEPPASEAETDKARAPSGASPTQHAVGPEGAELPGAPSIWELQSEQALTAELERALERADKHNRRVLLEFIAPWCTDCKEVVRASQQPAVKKVLEDRYEVVYVNVGRFDRHEPLLAEHEVDRIATLVVLEPDGTRLARTTLEPISSHQRLAPASLAAWLRHPTRTAAPLP